MQTNHREGDVVWVMPPNYAGKYGVEALLLVINNQGITYRLLDEDRTVTTTELLLGEPDPSKHPLTQTEMFLRVFLRPKNFYNLSHQERWDIDRKLGILDWNGCSNDEEALQFARYFD